MIHTPVKPARFIKSKTVANDVTVSETLSSPIEHRENSAVTLFKAL
jgi:hypothetical protein